MRDWDRGADQLPPENKVETSKTATVRSRDEIGIRNLLVNCAAGHRLTRTKDVKGIGSSAKPSAMIISTHSDGHRCSRVILYSNKECMITWIDRAARDGNQATCDHRSQGCSSRERKLRLSTPNHGISTTLGLFPWHPRAATSAMATMSPAAAMRRNVRRDFCAATGINTFRRCRAPRRGQRRRARRRRRFQLLPLSHRPK